MCVWLAGLGSDSRTFSFFIASIKADPFRILITSKIFHSFSLLLFHSNNNVRACIFVHCSEHNGVRAETGKSAMFSQSPSDIVDLVDFI